MSIILFAIVLASSVNLGAEGSAILNHAPAMTEVSVREAGVTLVHRYLQREGIRQPLGGTTGVIWGVTIMLDEARAKRLLDRFGVEFGYMPWIQGEVLEEVPCPIYVTHFRSPVPVQEMIEAFDKSSVVRAALVDSVSEGRLDLKEMAVEVSYGVRPWLTEDLRKSELAEVTVVCRDSEANWHKVNLAYAPGQ